MRKLLSVKQIESLVRWLCRKLSLEELFTAAEVIIAVLSDERRDIKCRGSFCEEHPHYRKFYVDPIPPLTESPAPQPLLPSRDWKQLVKQYKRDYGKELKPVRRRDSSTQLLNSVHCPHCGAPGKFIYYNDGKKRSQLRCKVCGRVSQIKRHHRPRKTVFWCPYCGYALFFWKRSENVTIHKCPNYSCPQYLAALRKLNRKERKLRRRKSSQFKLHYIYREYHFDPGTLVPAEPQETQPSIHGIHAGLDVLGLVLAYNVSGGVSARQTAYFLKNIHGIPISYQTVLNYSNAAAVLCHKFNLQHKPTPDSRVAGDETYIRVNDEWNYTWFTIGANSRAIHAYHLSDSRDAKHAAITLKETVRSLPNGQSIEFIGDGNPSYDSAVHFINAQSNGNTIIRRTVTGLKNDDPESEEFRPYKQLIERLNRTYKFHTRSRCGFKNFNGALALTVLFVTHYNFLRPHIALRYKCPVRLNELDGIRTLQGRWGKILQMTTQYAA